MTLSGRVVVTGANGIVGRRVVQRLLLAGADVVAVVRRHEAAAGIQGTRAHVVTDQGDAAAWRGVLTGARSVVHLVALTHGAAADADEQAFRRVNVDTTAAVARAAVATGVTRVVYMSSIKAVGEGGAVPLDESAVPHPGDAYGRTKLAAEQLVAQVCEGSATRWTVLRPPAVIASDARGNLARLARAVARGIPLPLASVRNARSLIAVRDLADAVGFVLAGDRAADAVLHVADESSLSTPEMVRRIAVHLGRPARLVPVPVPVLVAAGRLLGRPDEVRRLTDSLVVRSDAIRAMGWRGAVGVDAALAELAQAHRR